MNQVTDKEAWGQDYNQREVKMAVSTIVALNGAGTVALMAFLGQIWNPIPDLRKIILVSMAGMTLGLVVITLSILSRLRSMDRAIRDKPKNALQRLVCTFPVYSGLRSISFLLFVASVLYLFVKLYALAST